MSNKLLEITPQFNSFVDDQVLTSGQLNEFIEYFNEQDRLSRVCLSGVGVVCGFKIEENGSQVRVSQGCGVTTDGDLIKLVEDIPELEAQTAQDTKTIQLDELTFTHFRLFEDKKAKYGHFRSGNSVIELNELLTNEMVDEDENDAPISDLDLSDKVVVLYLESYQKEPNICVGSNCDNQGQENVQNLKVLLISKNDVETVVNSDDSLFTKHNVYEDYLALPEHKMPKVVLNAGFGGDNNTENYSKLAQAYKAVIADAKTDLHNNFTTLINGFSDILNINGGTQTTVLNQIDNLDDFTNNFGIQYRYDAVRDLSDTYNELANVLLKLKTECCPDIEAFPKHLLLGCLNATEVYPELRHEFYHSPNNTTYAGYLELAKSLFNRIVILLDNFNLGNSEGEGSERLLITPSKECGNLGEKAIPIYYDIDASLLTTWDLHKTKNYKQRYNLSYHRSNLAPGQWVQEPLKVALDCHDFYRIEGHYGRSAQSAKLQIEDDISTFGLDFEIKAFDIAQKGEDFLAFVRNHPSLQHLAGTPKGGTYVLVAENNEVIADFCLSYKVAKSSEASCCSLMECTFPWISSLKYLNNLSRSLKGTQSNNVAMPTHYRLQVIEYRINNERLINSTVTISIPLGQIFLRRMHAITEALNNRFNKGVVFDFNESQKRFVITRAKDDTFVIRLRDVTQANNNPIYTYSNNGMFRNNLIFRPDAMRCRDLKGYNEDFYAELQQQIAPVNKDDDYGTYDEKWRKWTTIRDRLPNHSFYTQSDVPRFITSREDLPNAIDNLISDIERELGTLNLDISLSLDGDWVNGTYIDESMLDYYRDNKKNTHDDIVLFVDLRKFLHKKTGVTKLSIYVRNQAYSAIFDPIITQFSTQADFYFGIPRGENAINL